MDTLLPSNQTLEEYSAAVPWQDIERRKRRFNQVIESIATDPNDEPLPLDEISDAVGRPVFAYYDPDSVEGANVFLANMDGHSYVLGSVVSKRYRAGKTLAQSIVPYNLNPSVNHTNIAETDEPTTRTRAMGAEIELGLYYPGGESPSEDEMQEYIHLYVEHAHRLGIYPRLDREAAQYQIETHIAPSVGYQKIRKALEGIMLSLTAASKETGLFTNILSVYAPYSDFKTTEHPKVQAALDLMREVNNHFPSYTRKLEEAKARYRMDPACHVVNVFRIQGCHIHMELAGRSEALGLMSFYTLLRSATALANAAVLKGGPFVNGTCDAERLCAREYLRQTTVTGRYIDLPTSPHFTENGLERYADLLRSEKANAVARAMLRDDGLGEGVSAMHNPIGRVRPDLPGSRRACTLESMGVSANISASRTAAVLTDFELSHAVIENYFRKYGCDLEPMYNDKTLWALMGPLDRETFVQQQDQSDRECTDVVLTTAAGTRMTLAEFYEMKRLYMHKALVDIVEITPRDIDDVYMSLSRMLAPPSGLTAQTIEQFVFDPKLKSTGNWGQILRNAYLEEGGVPGAHDPDAVLRVSNRLHNALCERYLKN
jgi:hypothetical protein